MFTHRPSLPAAFETFDIAFKPLFRAGRDGELYSAEHLIEARVCKDALAGKRKAVSVVLRAALLQDAERVKLEAARNPSMLTKQDRERRATTAMLLLGIASRALPDGGVRLEPWAADLALKRNGAPFVPPSFQDRINHFLRNPDTPEPAVFRLPVTDAAKKSPQATQFKKGQSGNPKGRPRKPKHHLPFTRYYDQIGTVRVNGRDQRMTRLQFVLHRLNEKAIKGDPCMTAVLADKYMRVRWERYRRGDDINRPSPLHNAPNLPQRIANDPFEQLLRTLRITNPRTTTRVLLEPWVVEAALAKFGDRRLTYEEQAEVLRSASKPAQVCWPDWWEITSHQAAKPFRPVKPRFRRMPQDEARY